MPKGKSQEIKGVEQQPSLNPNLKNLMAKSSSISVSGIIEGIKKGDTNALARGITLLESTLPGDAEKAQEIVQACLPLSGKSFRIGITGVPGVGKSTFIESFGKFLIHQQKKRVAVLAVDPSSQITKGSILGDKTRMEELSREKNAFIRPSPSTGGLGGVARKTRETIILCEAAGFDTIIIETVGVGQSETTVKSMVDFFLLLLLPVAGDELQGIKKGIMEMADQILINKADGSLAQKAKLASADVKRALRLFHRQGMEWQVPVNLISALENTGINDAWGEMEKYQRHAISKGYLEKNRKDQIKFWLQENIRELLFHEFYNNEAVKNLSDAIEAQVTNGKITPFSGAEELVKKFKGN